MRPRQGGASPARTTRRVVLQLSPSVPAGLGEGSSRSAVIRGSAISLAIMFVAADWTFGPAPSGGFWWIRPGVQGSVWIIAGQQDETGLAGQRPCHGENACGRTARSWSSCSGWPAPRSMRWSALAAVRAPGPHGGRRHPGPRLPGGDHPGRCLTGLASAGAHRGIGPWLVRAAWQWHGGRSG
jgi:hypothetical protein